MPTMATAFLGSICGIIISYAIGRRLGLYLVRTVGRKLKIEPDDLNKVEVWTRCLNVREGPTQPTNSSPGRTAAPPVTRQTVLNSG
jgi:hypothetical protein